MADVLAVRDEYRAQTWAMLIQKYNNRVGVYPADLSHHRAYGSVHGGSIA